MYTLLNKLGTKSLLYRETPTLLASWVLAECFYKFGSFTLETGAFLATWYLLGWVVNRLWKH
ncbi:hypothetical protein [Dinghuibacter silviterrae]|uniref:Uncharacterized protein n=1 Tax=Dinghuibacter silviterrae TaxID=1539049 RepID=A0A4R8DK10_9BACT|nr:hypothetical protein [Dinghuibacter silviterrae]TDW97340.1 hypothetical protein EDB95_5187 [Dinghuibacter silviterrae]